MKILNENQKNQLLKKLETYYNVHTYFNFVNGFVLFAKYFNECCIEYITKIFSQDDIFYYKIFIDNGDVFEIKQHDRMILSENKNDFLEWYKKVMVDKKFNEMVEK